MTTQSCLCTGQRNYSTQRRTLPTGKHRQAPRLIAVEVLFRPEETPLKCLVLIQANRAANQTGKDGSPLPSLRPPFSILRSTISPSFGFVLIVHHINTSRFIHALHES